MTLKHLSMTIVSVVSSFLYVIKLNLCFKKGIKGEAQWADLLPHRM